MSGGFQRTVELVFVVPVPQIWEAVWKGFQAVWKVAVNTRAFVWKVFQAHWPKRFIRTDDGETN